MIDSGRRQLAPFIFGMVVLPAIIYLVGFSILTYPRILQLSTHLFTDSGDGFQNYWNIWWINKAVTELHKPFWHTPYIHYPYGTTLLGHTLNPFNGLIAIPFLTFLSLVQVHNLIVVFSFVAGGVTAFLLAYYFTRSYWPSLIGGSVFTFSNSHFAHAEGHMQLVSLQWLPLFALLWYLLLAKPRPLMGVLAALALFLVALCDYYYLFYCVLLGGLTLLWRALRGGSLSLFVDRRYLVSFAAFATTALLTTGPLAISLVLLNARDPLVGAHPTRDTSLDLLGALIPGGHWRFAELTQAYWSRLPLNIHEASVHLGLSVIGIAIYVWIRRRTAPSPDVGLWYLVAGFFWVLSLGPVLHVAGAEVPWLVLPYALLEVVFPPLSMSGVPIRMMVMVTLAASVLTAIGFKMLFAHRPARRLLPALLLVMLAVEYLPSPIPAQRPAVPGYVDVLRERKDDKGVLDTVAGGTEVLYHQTIHEKPIAFGFIARIPKSVADLDYQLHEAVRTKDYDKLRDEFGMRYLVTEASTEVRSTRLPVTILYQDERVKLHDLGQ